MAWTEYSSLPQEDKALHDSEVSHRTDYLQRFVYWSIVVISVCSMIDVLALVYFAVQTSFHYPVVVSDMPIRSTYIHLEDLYLRKHHKSTEIEPIINLPQVLQVVDLSQPAQVFPQWAETWATPHGIVPVNDRRFLATNTVSILILRRGRLLTSTYIT
ncbi:hypothetical protein C8R44DRAFT_877882 [Mycena epipterygia]|nr:hypothetical protein C8R44DRAFT_877882 [Mycena epipterygia]